jgi:hypothetical protein
VSTRTVGGTVLVMVTVQVTLSAESAHLLLSVRDGPAPATWRFSLSDSRQHRIQYGRITGMNDHMHVLRYAAGMCKDAYQPGTTERGLLEQFAAPDEDQDGDS